MSDRRFRDMSLTEEEVSLAVYRWPYSRQCKSSYTQLEARAKRLLPLWRQWGLQRLKDEGRSEGYVCGADDARFGRLS